jgi:hypothetical protein
VFVLHVLKVGEEGGAGEGAEKALRWVKGWGGVRVFLLAFIVLIIFSGEGRREREMGEVCLKGTGQRDEQSDGLRLVVEDAHVSSPSDSCCSCV